MTQDDIAMDISEDNFEELENIAEMADGTLAVTADGRLVVYGPNMDAAGIVKEQPYSAFYVTFEGDHVLGFKF
jgi:hypothetical protein